jgi:hypothetical protein
LERRARRRRLRHALATAGQAGTAALSCALWVGLASPGLQLLPGLDRLGDRSISISLQSAVLGIDDGSGRPSSELAARAAAEALGLSYSDDADIEQRSQSGRPAAPGAPLVVQLEVGSGGVPELVRPVTDSSDSSSERLASVPAPAAPAAAPAAQPDQPALPAPAPRQTPAASPLAPIAASPPVPAPVARAPQSIVFTSSIPEAFVGGPAYTVAARADSGLKVAVTPTPTSEDICRVSGWKVTFEAVGTCVLEARQGGNAAHRPAPAVHQSIPVGKAPQAISFDSLPPAIAVEGGSSYTVAATASSGLPVSFSIAEESEDVCSVSRSKVAFHSPGVCAIDADQPGDATYLPAPRARQSVTVGPAKTVSAVSGQTISFISTPPSAVVGGSAYTVAAVASSGLPVDYSAAAASTGVCTVSGATVQFVGEGTCSINADQSGGPGYDAAARVQQSFPVDRAAQAVSFDSQPPVGAVSGGADYVVAASASSGLPVQLSVAAASASVCAVSGSRVAFIAAGTCTIDADQPGDSAYLPAAQVQQSFAVGAAAPSLSVQTINFSSTAPSAAVVGGPDYVAAATASSGLPVTFSIDPASVGVCSLSGSTVSLVGVGTCTIDVDQAGDASYQPAQQAEQSFTVGRAPQAISFTSSTPTGAVTGDPDYTISATSSSGLAVTFSAAPGSAGICTVSGATVVLVGPGTCIVEANQAGDASYLPAAQVEQAFAIASPTPSAQSIGFTSSPPGGAVLGGPAYTVAASASSGLAVVFTAAAASAGICTVSSSTVALLGVGTCTVLANQPGNADYQAAPQVQQSFTISAAPLSAQTISFTSSPPVGSLAGDPDYIVSAAASSGLAVVFSAAPASAGICTVSGSAISLVGIGTCVINADQPGDAGHQPAPRVQQSFSIGGPPVPSVQSISFTSIAPGGAVVGGPAYTVSATASSGLPVSFSAAPASAGVCAVTGSTVSLVGSGTCTILADQPGDASYEGAPQEQQSFVVGLSPQAISFNSSPPAAPTVSGPAYTVVASASSGLAVSFSLTASSAGVCSLSGSTVSFVGAGTCTINADQAGNGSYQAAASVQQSFAVTAPSPSAQTISFTSSAPGAAVVGGSPYTVAAAASSGLLVTFSIDPSSTGVCTISGSTVSFAGSGSCRVNANQAGNASYQAAAQVQQAFTVSLPPPSTQSISFTSSPPGAATVGGPAYTVAATATSGLAVAFSAAASSAGVCTVSGSTVSLIGGGTCTIDGNQAGNGSYQAAAQVQQSFTIARLAQTIAFTSTAPAAAINGGSAYTVTATASSGLAVTFTAAPSSAGICTVSGSTVSFVGGGTCTIYANQAGNSSYLPGPQEQQSFTVAPATQTVTITSNPGPVGKNSPPYTVVAVASSGLPVAFSIAPASDGICSIVGSTVSFHARGDCYVIAYQAGNANYQSAWTYQHIDVKNHV